MVIIMGPKHSGKTSAGKALARLWKERAAKEAAAFIDLDELVEQRGGKSPRQLYKEGPECFRKAEAEALQSLFGKVEQGGGEALIVASGGGIADNQEALGLLEKNKSSVKIYSVYIDIPAETAWERIKAAAGKTGELPPFLNTANPQETHRLLHERRGAIYRKIATHTVTAGNTPEETAAKILTLIG
ncbi:MAG: shikimate kinase [Treponema sp.]|jgi:shikimate kinase|nr:shikimate kinase [Treponema sp.]